jgi:serine/threonine-protein kinase RsbT
MAPNRATPDGEAIPVAYDTDVVQERALARSLALRAGFIETDLVLFASAVSEIAHNIVEYTNGGGVVLSVIHDRSRLGLPGSRRLMDEFRVESTLGLGTAVIVRKWVA